MSIASRKRTEYCFKMLGLGAMILLLSFLAILLFGLVARGYSAFYQTKIRLTIDLTGYNHIDQKINYQSVIWQALKNRLNEKAEDRNQLIMLGRMLSIASNAELKNYIKNNPAFLGKRTELSFTASSAIDMLHKGKIDIEIPETMRIVKDQQISWFHNLRASGDISYGFNSYFFTHGDSREPELAGIFVSAIGSLMTVIIFLAISVPIGVSSALYLEELAPKNKITDLIEISISNLAAVPSIIFGLLALVFYLGLFGLARSSALVGGLTLSFMMVPNIIISTRNTIRAIPNGIRDAAMALGANKIQIIFHHILPLSVGGITTGTILAMSRTIGETAPLLLIGMVAFIVNAPSTIIDPTTVMPVQIYLWSSSSELGFAEKTPAAILMLLLLLMVLNSTAIYIRKKFTVRW